MPHVRGTVHGLAAMGVVIVGAVLTDAIREHFEVFARLGDTTIHLLIDVAQLPVSEEIAGIVVPVGILMGIWVFAYELRRVIKSE